MITKEQLNSMQNYEISLLLCELLGYMVTFIHPYHESEMPTINVAGKTLGGFYAVEFDRWDCLMPLAIEYGITYGSVFCPAGSGPVYTAKQIDGDVYTDYEPTPQRAIVCCLILVLQEKQNEGQIQTGL